MSEVGMDKLLRSDHQTETQYTHSQFSSDKPAKELLGMLEILLLLRYLAHAITCQILDKISRTVTHRKASCDMPANVLLGMLVMALEERSLHVITCQRWGWINY